MDNFVSIAGNITRDPELRFTPAGTALCNFGVAVSRRWQDRNTKEWEEKTSFFNVTCWKDLAQNVADSLSKGDRVIVTGRLEQRSWETNEGERRSVVEIQADDVAPSLRWATCEVERTRRESAEDRAAETVKQAFDPSEEPF